MTFYDWMIRNYQGDNSPRGGLADDMKRDKEFTNSSQSINQSINQSISNMWKKEREKEGKRVSSRNCPLTPENYADNLKANFIYKDKYVYEGWIGQYNYTDTEEYIKEIGITSEINQFYEGHYALVCKLPNAIVNDKTSSLKIIINLGDYE